jgi:carbonic anhydrase/acetyltransferase-like protein (isoleucine patch superfamily)
MGSGIFLAPDSVVGSRARLENGVIVNTHASVDHDCVIGPVAHLGPGAHLWGGVRVGTLSLIGAGSCARPGAVIGNRCIVAAGAAVVGDVDDGTTMVGVPARPIQPACLTS